MKLLKCSVWLCWVFSVQRCSSTSRQQTKPLGHTSNFESLVPSSLISSELPPLPALQPEEMKWATAQPKNKTIKINDGLAFAASSLPTRHGQSYVNTTVETGYFGCSPENAYQDESFFWCSAFVSSNNLFRDDGKYIGYLRNAKDLFVYRLSTDSNSRIFIYGMNLIDHNKVLTAFNNGSSVSSGEIGKLLFDSTVACPSSWNATIPCLIPLLTAWKVYNYYMIVNRNDLYGSTCIDNYLFRLNWFVDDFVSAYTNVAFPEEIDRVVGCPYLALAYSGSLEEPKMYVCISDLEDVLDHSCPSAYVDPLLRRRLQVDTRTLLEVIGGVFSDPKFYFIGTFCILGILFALYTRYRVAIHSYFARVFCGKVPPVEVRNQPDALLLADRSYPENFF